MGFLDAIGRFASEGLFLVGNMLTEAALSVQDYVERARVVVSEQIDRFVKPRCDDSIRHDLHEINLELAHLSRKKRQDGTLSNRDRERCEELIKQRDQHKKEWQEGKAAESTQNVADNPESIKTNIITPENVHILLYHVGQSTAGKKCPSCGRDMILQFKQGQITISLDQIFWGCTGFMRGCRQTCFFQSDDLQLFTQQAVHEFECSNEELGQIFDFGNTQEIISNRIYNHKNQEIGNYTCPQHGLPLVLREKQNAKGLLDQFFLGCPMWKHGTCNYIMKIKSPAQLAAVLQNTEGRGIL